MSDEKHSRAKSRASFPHIDPALKAQNPLYEKVAPLTPNFEKERCPLHAAALAEESMSEAERRQAAMARDARRESFMIKRQRPHHHMQPPRHLSYGPDAQSFERQMREDYVASLRGQENSSKRQSEIKSYDRAARTAFKDKRLKSLGVAPQNTTHR
ncbi:MAG: hypothetical protein AAF204_05530 [Pseudomonadota bacterium]